MLHPTGRTDQSDRPVGPTIVPCKRPVTRVAFVYNGPKGMELAPNPRYSGGN